MPLCCCAPSVGQVADLSLVTLRAPEGCEVMICTSRIDGFVTAGGNTLIVRNRMLTYFSLFTFSSSDISPGHSGSVPFQDRDLF